MRSTNANVSTKTNEGASGMAVDLEGKERTPTIPELPVLNNDSGL